MMFLEKAIRAIKHSTCFVLIGTVSVGAGAAEESIGLADFEWSSIPQVRPSKTTDPETRDLWNQYSGDFSEDGDEGLASVTTEDKVDGDKALKINVTGGNIYVQTYTYTDETLGWDWLREHLHSSTPKTWKFDTYNRLKFWIKLAPGIEQEGGGEKNVSIGTYVRKSTGDKASAESGGHHFYHYLDLKSTGEWHQIIIDPHPDHDRGANGSKEHGVQEYPTEEAGFNYFDALTRFYFEVDGKLPSYPAVFYLDGFEFYQETREGDAVEQVFGVNGTYVPSTNEVVLGWRRNKNEGTKTHEVRYAFSDIHDLGWDNATAAPSGVVTPPNKFAYNGMYYHNKDIDMGNNENIYFAIKQTGQSDFRQIVLPINKDPNRPVAPSGLTVTEVQ